MRRPTACVIAGLGAIVALCVLAGRGAHSGRAGLGSGPPEPPASRHPRLSDDAKFSLSSGDHRPQGALARAVDGHQTEGDASGTSGADAQGAAAPVAMLPDSVRQQPWRAAFYCPADFNKDDRVDEEDARLFFAVYAERSGPMAGWLDLDGDGAVTGEDVAAFLAAYVEGDCDVSARARLREELCKAVADFGEENPTVTASGEAITVSGNGFSMTGQLGEGGVVTSVVTRRILLSAVLVHVEAEAEAKAAADVFARRVLEQEVQPIKAEFLDQVQVGGLLKEVSK